MWCHLPTIFKQRHALQIAGLVAMCVALITTLLFGVVSYAAPGINQTLSFQGRLLTAGGGVVPDGHYNIQFKIYQDGSKTGGGTLKWYESYVNNHDPNGAVEVKNGYFSVNLGSINAFGTQVDWNQDSLWLSMNVAGTDKDCVTFNTSPCVGDGEMLPMKRITSVPFAINSAQLGGKTANNFVQLAQGVQTDASNNTSSIFINKTGTGGSFLQLQNGGTDLLTIDSDGDLSFGSSADHYIGIRTSEENTAGHQLMIEAGHGGSGSGANGGNLVLQGGDAGGTSANGGDVYIDAGVATGSGQAGNITIGTTAARSIIIGSTYLGLNQDILIGANNTAGNTTNVTVGNGANSAGGTTKIQSKDNTTIATNGVDRATFDTNGKLYLGNGASSVSPSNFTIQGTSSSATGVNGSTLTVQGGNATTGNADGGNLVISGGSGSGTGKNGLVLLSATSIQAVNDSNCYMVASSCTISSPALNGNSTVIIGFTAAGQTVTLPNPANTTAGRLVYITAASNSEDFTLSINGGGSGNLTAMRKNTTATLIWNGSAWTVAGASNSTTLQAAYDNTIQSSGGAELIVGKTGSTNGLTIRDSATNSVDGALLQVQSKTASNLFSVNSNVTDYASNPGGETPLSSTQLGQFPSNTWSGLNGGSITRNTTPGNNTIATGQASVGVTTSAANSGIANQIVDPAQSTPTPIALIPNSHYNVSFSVRLPANASIFNDLKVDYSKDGTNTIPCISAQTVAINVWTKINCSFTTPASGVTASNAIFIRQAGAASRTFYVDNLSVTIAADYNLATDGGVNDTTNFNTNWPAEGTGSTTTYASESNTASYSAQATLTNGAAFAGVKNKLSINPNLNTRYRISVYTKLSSGGPFTDFAIRYTPTGNSNYRNCEDYSNQNVTSAWTKTTCYINTDGTSVSNPQVAFVQTASSTGTRVFLIDDFSMTLATPTTPNVQIGSGNNGGPTTLLTLDKAASAPIAGDNDQLLGSMYYDTTIGKLQCYEADGWGSCGSAPDNIITISPEYSNAVMHGTGVGTMTSDICTSASDLHINDGTNGQPTICGANETHNFYKWTSPQASAQTYSIYVTYQLPSTFKAFASGMTSLQAKTDSSNASVVYKIYKSNGNGMTPCSGDISVASGVTGWNTGVAGAANDPFVCGFSAGDSVVFKITASSRSNANAYIGNLGFTFSNK